jgi:hypothetical protein
MVVSVLLLGLLHLSITQDLRGKVVTDDADFDILLSSKRLVENWMGVQVESAGCLVNAPSF